LKKIIQVLKSVVQKFNWRKGVFKILFFQIICYWIGGCKDQNTNIHPSSLLPCFVCFVLFYQIENSQTMLPLVTLLVLLESFQLIGVHPSCFAMFRPIVKELLNLNFFNENSIQLKFIVRIGCLLLVLMENPL
jgi:hypothetical protein